MAALGALVAARTALSLSVLADSGSRLLPGFPAYEYDPRPGDAYGYYSAMRELLATPPRLGWALPLFALAALGLVAVVVLRLRGRGRPDVLVLLGFACVALALLALVLRMRYAGAPTIGWPAAWSVPVFPYRLLGLPLDPDVGFGFAVALSLLANAVIVVATFLLGLWVSGRRAVGLVAAVLAAASPLVLLVLGRTRDLGTWGVDLGLYAYSEPLSTALVVAAVVLLVRAAADPVAAVTAGALLGFAVTVRLSNAIVAAVAVGVLLLGRRWASATRVAAGGIVFLPVVIAYWPLGYERLPEEQFPDDPFALEHAGRAWSESAVWGWKALLVLVPVAAIGALRLPRAWSILLVGWVAGTALFYTFYRFTAEHPRFLLVVLPALFVLWSAGAVAVLDAARRRSA